MNALLSNPSDKKSRPATGRRSFVFKAGAAVSAALASAAAGFSKPGAGPDAEVKRLSHQLGILEDEREVRRLHQSYESLLDQGMYDEVAALFADDAEVVFNGGVFAGKDKGVCRLYSRVFRAGLTGKKIGPHHGSSLDEAQASITVEADRRSARARFPYCIQVGTPMPSDLPLVQMARLHGGGIMKWCESGTCEVSYVKDNGGTWKIKKLEYRVLSQTDYRQGRAYANPVDVPQFVRTFPGDPAGPDRLIG